MFSHSSPRQKILPACRSGTVLRCCPSGSDRVPGKRHIGRTVFIVSQPVKNNNPGRHEKGGAMRNCNTAGPGTRCAFVLALHLCALMLPLPTGSGWDALVTILSFVLPLLLWVSLFIR